MIRNLLSAVTVILAATTDRLARSYMRIWSESRPSMVLLIH